MIKKNNNSHRFTELIRNLKSVLVKPGNGVNNGIGENYLAKNRPDPFNSKTEISFFLIKEYFAKLIVTDPKGNLIKILFVGHLQRGDYSFSWDGKNQRSKKVEAGNYNYKLILEPDSYLSVRKMNLKKNDRSIISI